MIKGIKITKLKIIPDERGKVMHMMRNDSPVFKKIAIKNNINFYLRDKKFGSSNTKSDDVVYNFLQDKIDKEVYDEALRKDQENWNRAIQNRLQGRALSRITNSIKYSEAHYAPLLVWIIGKIITSSAIAKQNTNPKLSLEKSGIWNSKIASYMNFIKFHSLQKLISMQKNVYELDLTSKGLSKKNFWDEVEKMIVNLTTN